LIFPKHEKVCKIKTPTLFWHTFTEDLGLALKFTREKQEGHRWGLGRSMQNWHTFVRDCGKLAYKYQGF
jgi:hypothetical protein